MHAHKRVTSIQNDPTHLRKHQHYIHAKRQVSTLEAGKRHAILRLSTCSELLCLRILPLLFSLQLSWWYTIFVCSSLNRRVRVRGNKVPEPAVMLCYCAKSIETVICIHFHSTGDFPICFEVRDFHAYANRRGSRQCPDRQSLQAKKTRRKHDREAVPGGRAAPHPRRQGTTDCTCTRAPIPGSASAW